MSIFLTGATGFIGRAVLERLRAERYEVTALVSTAADAEAVTAAGATPFLGTEEETRTLSDVVIDSDGVIHLATSKQFDGDFIDAVLPGLEGSDKSFIYTGSIWTYGSNPDITEKSPQNPPSIASWFVDYEKRLMATDGVRVSIVTPAIVYGHGQGLVRLITDAVDGSGASATLPLIGDGSQHWATVHVDDLADLYLRVFEKVGHNDEVYIGASDAAPTVAELGAAAAEAAGIAGGARPQSVQETRARLGAGSAEALLLDQHARADKARDDLGWSPTRPSLLDEIRLGYATAAQNHPWS